MLLPCSDTLNLLLERLEAGILPNNRGRQRDNEGLAIGTRVTGSVDHGWLAFCHSSSVRTPFLISSWINLSTELRLDGTGFGAGVEGVASIRRGSGGTRFCPSTLNEGVNTMRYSLFLIRTEAGRLLV